MKAASRMPLFLKDALGLLHGCGPKVSANVIMDRDRVKPKHPSWPEALKREVAAAAPVPGDIGIFRGTAV